MLLLLFLFFFFFVGGGQHSAQHSECVDDKMVNGIVGVVAVKASAPKAN